MRMRPHPILFLTLSTLVLMRCGGSKEVPHTYPATTSTDLRGDFVAQFQRGEILYRTNCGGCHNKWVNGHLIIPDFSIPQLLDYEMRTQYPSHGERLHESKVSKEELDDIQVFLQYRKPSGHPLTPPPVLHPPKVN